jgi:hypothetical protein
MWRDEHYLRRERAKRMSLAKRTYYLNADRSEALPAKAVREGEDDTPEGAAFLLVRKGSPISDADARRYGVETEEPPAPPREEPNIVTSGGRDTGPGVVKGEPLTQEEARAEAPAPAVAPTKRGGAR